MGGAILRGMLAQNALPQFQLHVVDPNLPLTEEVTASSRISLSRALPESSTIQFDVVLIAIKPQLAADVLPQLLPVLNDAAFIISIMAGRSCTNIQKDLQRDLPVIRAMPNLPVQVGEGMTTVYPSPQSSREQLAIAQELFGSVGEVLTVDSETLVDAATALAGSGPGFVFHMMAAAVAEAVELGFTKEQARQLLSQTVIGATRLAEESDKSLEELEAQVTSPKGTTEAGISSLQSDDCQSVIRRSLRAAYSRARELR